MDTTHSVKVHKLFICFTNKCTSFRSVVFQLNMVGIRVHVLSRGFRKNGAIVSEPVYKDFRNLKNHRRSLLRKFGTVSFVRQIFPYNLE